MEGELSQDIIRDRGAVKAALQEIFALNQREKELTVQAGHEDVMPKSEWMARVDQLDADTFSRIESAMTTLFRDKHLLTDEQLRSPRQDGEENDADYKKNIIIRDDDLGFVVTAFTWQLGSKTPSHRHTLRCALCAATPPGYEGEAPLLTEISFKALPPDPTDPFAPPKHKADLFQTIQQNRASTRRPNCPESKSIGVDADRHVVMLMPEQGRQTGDVAYTFHVYLTHGISRDLNCEPKYLDMRGQEMPTTAIISQHTLHGPHTLDYIANPPPAVIKR